VLDEQEGDPLAVGVLDEVGHLLGAFGVDDSPDLRGPPGSFSPALAALDDPARVGDQRDRAARDGAVSADHLGRLIGLELVQLSRVEQALERRADVVTHAVVRWQEVVQVLGTALGLAARRGRPERPRQTQRSQKDLYDLLPADHRMSYD